MKSGFIVLTHPTAKTAIAVRAERVVMVEDCGDSMRLVATDTGESFMCSESVEDVVRAIDGALS